MTPTDLREFDGRTSQLTVSDRWASVVPDFSVAPDFSASIGIAGRSGGAGG
jgi:hypothetical protein